MSRPKRAFIVPVVSAWLLASGAALAQPEPALEPEALATLRRMAETLRALPSLRVEAQVEYDAVQPDGQTIEFGSTREIAVRRPNRIRAAATDRSGAERNLFYDGRRVTVLDRAQGVYATAEQTGDVDPCSAMPRSSSACRSRSASCSRASSARGSTRELVFAAVVGVETLDGVRCEHLALRNRDRGIQLWIEQGKTPLPRRIAITWEQAPGRPQFRARLTKWELAPELPDALFAFEPPEGMERIRFHVRPAAPPAAGGR